MLAWRWPLLVGPHVHNPDESQMIAGAITLRHFPIFWKYVDGTTHGPMVDFALLAGHFLGLPLNYGGARFLSGLLAIGGLVAAGCGLMHRYDARSVRIGLAPAIFLYASMSYYEFAGYTSEILPVFLILLSVGVFVPVLVSDRMAALQASARCFVSGASLGLLPWAKLQSAPVGLVAGMLGIVALLASTRRPSWPDRWRKVGATIAGALTPTLIFAVYLWIWGLGGQFRVTYIENNLAYTAHGSAPLGKMLSELWGFMHAAPGLPSLTIVTAVAAAVSAAVVFFRPRVVGVTADRAEGLTTVQFALEIATLPPGSLWTIAAWFVFCLSSVAVVILPGSQFAHYLQFLIPPIALGSVIYLGELARFSHLSGRRRRSSAIVPLVFLLVSIAALAVARSRRADPDWLGRWTQNGGEWRTPAGLAIRELSRPGDTLSVWGWMPHFYVEANLPQATREAHTFAQIMPLPLVDFYRERFLRDFARSRPRIFVDAAGPGNFSFMDRAQFGHEIFPEFAAIIARDYEFVLEVSGSRIYMRKADAQEQSR